MMRLDRGADDTACRHCGSDVTGRFRAVFGDADDDVAHRYLAMG